jgi:hypothetical protein
MITFATAEVSAVKVGIARSVAFITFRFILLFRKGIGTRPGDDSSSIALPPSTIGSLLIRP